jgi:rRNA maturation RNase YbeY
LGNLHYIFVDDAEITQINIQHLQHDYATDIITFDYSEGNKISGEIFISLDTLRSNAEDLNIDFHQELLRVMVHGVLHLCGLKDKTKEEKERMREAEEKMMRIFDKLIAN